MRKILSRTVLFVLCFAILGFSSAGILNAQPKTSAEFFAKNTVNLIVPVSPGGGTDYGARVIADFWAKFTGGMMLVKNMPGANALLGQNTVYHAKPDGLTLGFSETAQMIPAYIFRLPGVQYDIYKYNWFGLIAPVPYAFVISQKVPAKSMQELQKVEGLRFGSCDASGTDTLADVLVAEAFNLKNPKVIAGFPGTSDIGLAIARGELEGAAYHPIPVTDWITKNFVKSPPLVTLWPERVSYWPDTPAIGELVKLSPEQQSIFKLHLGLKSSKVFYAPPGLPEEKARFVRETFEKMLTDEKFLEQMKKVFKVWLKPLTGKETLQYMESLKEIGAQDIDIVHRILKSRYGLGK